MLSLCISCLKYNLETTKLDCELKNILQMLAMTKSSIFEFACKECLCLMRLCNLFSKRCQESNKVLTGFLCDYNEITQENIQFLNRSSIEGILQTNELNELSESIKSICEESKIQNYNVQTELDLDHYEPENYTEDTELVENNSLNNVKLNDHDPASILTDEKIRINGEIDQPSQSEDSEDDMPLSRLIDKNIDVKPKNNKTDTLSEKKYLQAREIILSKQDQINEILLRKDSDNYKLSPYKCNLCFKGFINDKAYENHMAKHDKKNGDFECEICKFRFDCNKRLHSHTYSLHSRRFECRICSYRSLTIHQAQDHQRSHAGITYKCKRCWKEFKKSSTHFTHIRKCHPKEFNCLVCGDSFVSQLGLLLHCKKNVAHKDAKEDSSPQNERYCHPCNIQFMTKTAWELHVLRSKKHMFGNHNSTYCLICKKEFDTNAVLSLHLKNHNLELWRANKPTNSNVTVSCHMCDLKFLNKSQLNAHIKRIHLGVKYNKLIVCDVCGKHCNSNAALKYHQRTHTGERPYACVDCPKRFSDGNQLKIHSRTHTGAKPYKCGICEKSFGQKPSLNRHIRVHTGARPYVCEYCAKGFTQSNSLKIHLRMVHHKDQTTCRKVKSEIIN